MSYYVYMMMALSMYTRVTVIVYMMMNDHAYNDVFQCVHVYDDGLICVYDGVLHRVYDDVLNHVYNGILKCVYDDGHNY